MVELNKLTQKFAKNENKYFNIFTFSFLESPSFTCSLWQTNPMPQEVAFELLLFSFQWRKLLYERSGNEIRIDWNSICQQPQSSLYSTNTRSDITCRWIKTIGNSTCQMNIIQNHLKQHLSDINQRQLIDWLIDWLGLKKYLCFWKSCLPV